MEIVPKNIHPIRIHVMGLDEFIEIRESLDEAVVGPDIPKNVPYETGKVTKREEFIDPNEEPQEEGQVAAKTSLQEDEHKSKEKRIAQLKKEVADLMLTPERVGFMEHSPFTSTKGWKSAKSYESPSMGTMAKPTINYHENGDIKNIDYEEMHIGFNPSKGVPKYVIIYSNRNEDFEHEVGSIVSNESHIKRPGHKTEWYIQLKLVEKFALNPIDKIAMDKTDKLKGETYAQYEKEMKGKTAQPKEEYLKRNIRYLSDLKHMLLNAYSEFFNRSGGTSNQKKISLRREIADEFFTDYFEDLTDALTTVDLNSHTGDFGIARKKEKGELSNVYDILGNFEEHISKLVKNPETLKHITLPDKKSWPPEKKGKGAPTKREKSALARKMKRSEMPELSEISKKLVEYINEMFEEIQGFVIVGPVGFIFRVRIGVKGYEKKSMIDNEKLQNKKMIDEYTNKLEDESISKDDISFYKSEIKRFEHNQKILDKLKPKDIENLKDIEAIRGYKIDESPRQTIKMEKKYITTDSDYIHVWKKVFDDEGNPVLDDEGEQVTKHVKVLASEHKAEMERRRVEGLLKKEQAQEEPEKPAQEEPQPQDEYQKLEKEEKEEKRIEKEEADSGKLSDEEVEKEIIRKQKLDKKKKKTEKRPKVLTDKEMDELARQELGGGAKSFDDFF